MPDARIIEESIDDYLNELKKAEEKLASDAAALANRFAGYWDWSDHIHERMLHTLVEYTQCLKGILSDLDYEIAQLQEYRKRLDEYFHCV